MTNIKRRIRIARHRMDIKKNDIKYRIYSKVHRRRIEREDAEILAKWGIVK